MASPPEKSGIDPAATRPASEDVAGAAPAQDAGTSRPSLNPTVLGPVSASDLPTAPPLAKSDQANLTGVTPGRTLGPYELLGKLGEGGMGAVYKARHQHLDMLVAIKVLPQQFTQQPESVARFKREMKAVGRIRHPNIVQAMDAGEIDGTHFLAMEYIEGSDLAKLVGAKGTFSVVNACKAVKQAAQALSAAHAAGLVHRDIKPSNLLVAKSGQIKILDLGLALLGEDGGMTADVTAQGQTFGTPDYMAPEQWADAHSADARTDLYALGCTLFFLLVGRAPYGDERHRTPLNKMTAHVTEAVPDLKAARAETPDGVVAIYRKLMAKAASERYQTADELVAALGPFASGKAPLETPATTSPSAITAGPDQLTASRSSASGTAVDQPDSPTMPTQRPRDQRAGGRRIPRWLMVTGPLVAVCVLIGLYVALSNRGEPKSPDENLTTSTATASSDPQPSTLNPQPTAWHNWPADAPKPAIAPFDAAQAKKHQEEWAAYLKVPVEWENSIGMKFRLIPPGEFLRGSSEAEQADVLSKAKLKPNEDQSGLRRLLSLEHPQHRVTLTKPLYFAVHEVTQQEYEQVVGVNPSDFSSKGKHAKRFTGIDTRNHPVEKVNRQDSLEFCQKLSTLESLPPFTVQKDEVPASGYRLPTDAEWESACRAGTIAPFWYGEDSALFQDAEWIGSNANGTTHPVGTRQANPYGLRDMLGNVREMTLDDDYNYQRFAGLNVVDPVGMVAAPDAVFRRGGGIWSDVWLARSAYRSNCGLAERGDHGFRVVLSVDDVKQMLGSDAADKVGWHGWPADAPKPAIAPFDADQAKKHQEEWAAYLKIPVEREIELLGGELLSLVLVPPGEFLMGGTPEEQASPLADPWISGNPYFVARFKEELPSHPVRITRPFYIGKYEVTQKQWEAVMGSNPSKFVDNPNHPVEQVGWSDIEQFLAIINTNLKEQDLTANLPTEAQWELACRAGTKTPWACGIAPGDMLKCSWLKTNSQGHSNPVGRLLANSFGIHDLHGNVSEWCDDWYGAKYYSQSPLNDPIGPQMEDYRVHRGGSFNGSDVVSRSAFRDRSAPKTRLNTIGCRLAATISLDKFFSSRPATVAKEHAPPPVAGWRGWPADVPQPAIAPFDAPQAKKHQEEWAAYLQTPVEWENSIGMKFRLIPPGEFLMGSADEEAEAVKRDALPLGLTQEEVDRAVWQTEMPQHRVALTRPIGMGSTEVTIGQFAKFADAEKHVTLHEKLVEQGEEKQFQGNWRDPKIFPVTDDFPVMLITLDDAIAFCNWLSEQENLPACYRRSGAAWERVASDGYRLPTEAEWEFACRAGTTGRFFHGDELDGLKQYAWTKGNSEICAHAVANLQPNPFGLYDMPGNVWELCQDYFDPAWYSRGENINPLGPATTREVTLRGGSWFAPANDCRSAARGKIDPNFRWPANGFRVVCGKLGGP